jgi:hypothetical protein
MNPPIPDRRDSRQASVTVVSEADRRPGGAWHAFSSFESSPLVEKGTGLSVTLGA